MRVCGFCGPYKSPPGNSMNDCVYCGLDPGEVRAIQEVTEYGFEEALRREAKRALRSS